LIQFFIRLQKIQHLSNVENNFFLNTSNCQFIK
jgi:hypothetical protein